MWNVVSIHENAISQELIWGARRKCSGTLLEHGPHWSHTMAGNRVWCRSNSAVLTRIMSKTNDAINILSSLTSSLANMSCKWMIIFTSLRMKVDLFGGKHTRTQFIFEIHRRCFVASTFQLNNDFQIEISKFGLSIWSTHYSSIHIRSI